MDAVSFKEVSDETFDHKDRLIECSINIAASDLDQCMEETGLYDALASKGFSSFALDLGPACSVVAGFSPNGYPRYVPSSARISESDYLRQASRNVHLIRKKFEGKIKVENLNYFPTGAYEMVCHPDFICRVLRQLDIGLLLDIGHLKISAQNLNIPLDAYIEALPLERVTEVQVSGAGIQNGIWEDLHDLPSEEDWAILEKVISLTSAEYVTLEYYRDGCRLVEAYKDLYGRIHQR